MKVKESSIYYSTSLVVDYYIKYIRSTKKDTPFIEP